MTLAEFHAAVLARFPNRTFAIGCDVWQRPISAYRTVAVTETTWGTSIFSEGDGGIQYSYQNALTLEALLAQLPPSEDEPFQSLADTSAALERMPGGSDDGVQILPGFAPRMP